MKLILALFLCSFVLGKVTKDEIFKIRKHLEDQLEEFHNAQVILMNKIMNSAESFNALNLESSKEEISDFFLAKDDLFRTDIDQINSLQEKAEMRIRFLKSKLPKVQDENFQKSNDKYIAERVMEIQKFEAITDQLLNQINVMRTEFNSDIKNFEKKREFDRIIEKENKQLVYNKLFRYLE